MIALSSRGSLLAAVIATAAGTATPAYSAPMTDTSLHTELQRIATRRIFFAHQSVGGNLLDGVQRIAAAEHFPLQIQEYPTADAIPSNTLGHTRIGENGKPVGKLQAFTKALGASPSDVNIAFLKFCYVDFTPETDIQTLFSSYRVSMEKIKAKHPRLTLVHVTVPLTVVQTGLKATVKQWFGKAPYGVLENARRDEYNNLLRQHYVGREPVFDLAQIESVTPNGSRTVVVWNGRSIPVLHSSYTDDGSHLNAQGRIHVARKLISVMAQIP